MTDHGTQTMYRKFKCRCADCTAWKQADNQKYRGGVSDTQTPVAKREQKSVPLAITARSVKRTDARKLAREDMRNIITELSAHPDTHALLEDAIPGEVSALCSLLDAHNQSGRLPVMSYEIDDESLKIWAVTQVDDSETQWVTAERVENEQDAEIVDAEIVDAPSESGWTRLGKITSLRGLSMPSKSAEIARIPDRRPVRVAGWAKPPSRETHPLRGPARRKPVVAPALSRTLAVQFAIVEPNGISCCADTGSGRCGKPISGDHQIYGADVCAKCWQMIAPTNTGCVTYRDAHGDFVMPV